MRLQGQVAIVTGAGRGIGAAVARKLAAEGAELAICDVDVPAAQLQAARLQEDGARAIAIAVDVTQRDSVQAMAQQGLAELGRVDILVNNAGVFQNRSALDMSEQEWSFVLDVNLKGSFLCSQAIAPYMVEQRYGKIVNVSSTSAYGSVNGQANYSSAKAGILGLTRTLALELGPFNINVNAVAPGVINVGMSVRSAELKGMDVQEYMQQFADRISLRRVGLPEDVANVICFLVSSEASYVHGEIVHVAGGPVRGY